MPRSVAPKNPHQPDTSNPPYIHVNGMLGTIWDCYYHSGKKKGMLRNWPACNRHGRAESVYLVCDHIMRRPQELEQMLARYPAPQPTPGKATAVTALCSDYPQRCPEHDQDHIWIICAPCVREALAMQQPGGHV